MPPAAANVSQFEASIAGTPSVALSRMQRSSVDLVRKQICSFLAHSETIWRIPPNVKGQHILVPLQRQDDVQVAESWQADNAWAGRRPSFTSSNSAILARIAN